MEYKLLKNIAQITMGQSPDSSSYNEEEKGLPFYQGNADFGELYPTARVWCDAPKKIASKGDILISVRAPIGALNYASEDCCIGRGLAAITIKNEAEKNYVYHLLKARKTDLNSKGTGSTFKAIGKSVLEEVQVPVISREQQEISMQLMDTIENVIRQRKKELRLLDELVKARFVEMFGDPENNPRGWDTRTIGDVITKIEAGWSGNGIQREKEEGEIAVLKVSAVTKGYFVPRECKVLDDQDNIKKMVCPENGDLIFSRANTRELVGATAIIDKDYPEYILSDKLWKIKFNDLVNVYYMKAVLSSTSIRSKFSESSTGTSGSMFNVSMEKFKSVRIPIAPIEFQNQYRDFVCAIDKSKFVV